MYGTYSPEDNKLRLYPDTRLTPEIYARVRTAGFIWAPKQELFVAPAWTPSREDLLLELCGEIEDEDTSLVDRAEQRADRFEDYSDKRRDEAERAHNYVSSIADNIPLGQPILVGHHSERRARKDAERITNGMRKAISLWDTSKYWTDRAKGAIRAAKYKERPDVRARRIKGLQAEKRKIERDKAKAESCLKLWATENLTFADAVYFSGRTEAGWLKMPRKAEDNPSHDQRPSAYDVLTNSYPSLYAPRTLEEVVEAAKIAYPRTIAWCDRWIRHYENRIAYEMAMLEEQGAEDLLKPKARPKQLPLCNYRQETFQIENSYHKGEFTTYRQVEMTQAQYKGIYEDRKGTRTIENSHRIRVTVDPNATGPYYSRPWVVVFLTDSKVHNKPEPVEPKPLHILEVAPAPKVYKEPERTKFDDLKDTLKAGVQVVSAAQLFPTSSELADEMVDQADIREGQNIAEPSAGTGNLIKAIARKVDLIKVNLHAVEISFDLVKELQRQFGTVATIHHFDFLEYLPQDFIPFDRIVMNPPFVNGADILHIKHALSMLAPGGRLVALCANGPRQRQQLASLSSEWIDLPEGSFKEQGTNVSVAMVIFNR